MNEVLHLLMDMSTGISYIGWDGPNDCSPKVTPKWLDRPLVAGHESRLLHVTEWDMNQTKKSKHLFDDFFSNMFSVILVCSNPTIVWSNINFYGILFNINRQVGLFVIYQTSPT